MRTISADIFTDEFFGTLSPLERVLWIGLIVKTADDQGRLRDNAALVRSDIFPYDDIPVADIEKALTLFTEHGKIIRYTSGANGTARGLIQIVNWWKFQRSASWMGASKFPAPEGWIDRYRFHGAGNQVVTQNWDQIGGLLPSALPSRGGIRDGDGEDDGEGEEEGDGKAEITPTTPADWTLVTTAPVPAATAPVSTKRAKTGQPAQIGALLSGVTKRVENSAYCGYTQADYNDNAGTLNPEIIYQRVTGLPTFPANIRADAQNAIVAIVRDKRLDYASAVEYFKPYFAAYTARKNKNGQPYQRTGYGWLEWALGGSIPQAGKAAQPARQIEFVCKPECPVCSGTAKTVTGEPCPNATAIMEARK